MKRLLHTLLLVLLLPLGVCGAASTTIHLGSYAKVTPANAKKVLSELYTLAEAKATFPDAFRGYATADKWTDAQVMNLAVFNAAWADALWKGATLVPQTGTRGLLLSRNTLVVPLGAWWLNAPLDYAFGTYEFPNSGTGNADQSGDVGGCELLHWSERWVGATGARKLIRAFHGGNDSFFAYSEGVAFEGGLRVNGRCGAWKDPAQPEVIGFEAWDFGEASDLQLLFVHQCDVGLDIIRGTPFGSSGMVSVFSNNVAGVRIQGGGVVNFHTLSGDDNPRLVQSVPGYGRTASCVLNINAVKSEWAVTPKGYGRTWKRQNILEAEGWTRCLIGVLSVACGAYQDALFHINPTVNTSKVEVMDVRVFGGTVAAALLHDPLNKETFLMDNGWTSGIQSFRWSSVGNGTLVSWPVQAVRIDAPHQQPLGYLEADPVTGQPKGSFDRVNGLPSWSDVTGSSAAPAPVPGPAPLPEPLPPTPTPAPVLTFATTFSGSGPNLVATKGSTITPSSGSTASFSSGVITTNANTKYPWAAGKAQRIVLLGVTLKAAPAYQHITANHVIYPDGRIFYRTVYNNPGGDVDTGVRMVQGVKAVSMSLPCPGGILNTVLGSPVGAGNGAPLTVEALEVYQ